MPAEELDHPCRNSCSGWKQGYERGKSEPSGALDRDEINYEFIKEVLDLADKMVSKRTLEVSISSAFIEKMGPVVDRIEAAHKSGKRMGGGGRE